MGWPVNVKLYSNVVMLRYSGWITIKISTVCVPAASTLFCLVLIIMAFSYLVVLHWNKEAFSSFISLSYFHTSVPKTLQHMLRYKSSQYVPFRSSQSLLAINQPKLITLATPHDHTCNVLSSVTVIQRLIGVCLVVVGDIGMLLQTNLPTEEWNWKSAARRHRATTTTTHDNENLSIFNDKYLNYLPGPCGIKAGDNARLSFRGLVILAAATTSWWAVDSISRQD